MFSTLIMSSFIKMLYYVCTHTTSVFNMSSKFKRNANKYKINIYNAKEDYTIAFAKMLNQSISLHTIHLR